MTIDEAITHAREVASRKFDDRVHCIRCAEEHEQLAEWLEELKAYRTLDKTNFSDGYNKAIDDYRTEICKAFVQSERNGNYRFYAVEIKQLIADLGEQLKEGGVDAGSI